MEHPKPPLASSESSPLPSSTSTSTSTPLSRPRLAVAPNYSSTSSLSTSLSSPPPPPPQQQQHADTVTDTTPKASTSTSTSTSTTAHAALLNATAHLSNLQLPHSAANRDPSAASSTLAVSPFRAHLRHPSEAGLQLQTDISAFTPSPTAVDSQSPCHTSDSLEGHMDNDLRQSATAPIPIQDGFLRSTLSAGSLTGSLSPGSAISSPALNALGDITPLPSPLVMGDSPGPWARAGAAFRPRSRGASSASSKDDSFAMLGRGTLSPSPSQKRKGYQRLQAAAVEAAAASIQSQSQNKNEASRERNRSISEFVPEALHNVRARHVTISNTASEGSNSQPHLHREAYLAAQRGLVPASGASSLPTPPASNASNASNRSVTESEGEDAFDDVNFQYIAVRHGSKKIKKLWRPVRQLGQGTFSKVFLATSEKTAAKDLDESLLDPHKLVAIKVCEHGPAGGADEERVELSLKREVEMLQSISHPSLIHLKAFDHDQSQALLVLTYCPGGDLFEVASAHREILGVNLVQRIFAELVSAVRYLHNQLIVHRDIKLENVLLNIPIATVPLLKHPQSHPYPLATLTDLGLSRRIPAPPESPLLTTRCGSEDYAAPEILLGQPYDGRATDAWALGVLLYALMEGRLPFDPPPGKVSSRSRPAHRIARCDWVWSKFGDQNGEWDPEKGKDWAGAKDCVEGLLKKVSRGRKSLEDIEKLEWVQGGITVEGGVRRRIEDEDTNEVTGDITAR